MDTDTAHCDTDLEIPFAFPCRTLTEHGHNVKLAQTLLRKIK